MKRYILTVLPFIFLLAAQVMAQSTCILASGAYSAPDCSATGAMEVTAGTGATDLGKAEDSAHASADTGVAVLTKRTDTAASSAGTTEDYATLNTDSLGRLWVTGSAVEDVAETAGGILEMAGTVRRDTAASSATSAGDNATLNTDAVGKLWISGAFAEDAGHTDGDIGIAVLTRRIAAPATSSGTAADYSTLDTDSYGRLYVNTGDTIQITTALTVDTAAYAAGDAITVGFVATAAARAGILTGRIKKVLVSDAAAQGVNLELVCSNIDATAATDQAAFDPPDAEIDNTVGPIAITNHYAWNDNGVSTSGDVNVPFGPLASANMDCFLVSRGAPDYVAATDVAVTLTIERD